MVQEAKRERRCVWMTWGSRAAQTVRFHLASKRYEISQSHQFISVAEKEVDSLIVALLDIRAKSKKARRNHGK